tara:strand:- start:404 stop:688 length:285 start_codon:yes stop_codon:yes gene_type:complete
MSLDTMLQIETAIGVSFYKTAQKLGTGDLTLSEIITIITLAIRSGGNDIDDKEVKRLVSQIGFQKAIVIVGDLLALALNSGEEEMSEQEKKSES